MSHSDMSSALSTSIRLAMAVDEQRMTYVEAMSRSRLTAHGIALNRFEPGGFVEDTSWDIALVAEHSGEIVGLIRASSDESDLIVDQLSVLPEWGGQGIGRQLLVELLNEGKIRGFSRILGTTFADVPFNAPWYRRLGAMVVDDHELSERRAVEQSVGLDALGRRAVVSFPIPQ